MADHGHAHDHGHGSENHGHRFTAIGVGFFILAVLELWIGSRTKNSSISSLGGHSLIDAGFPIVGGGVAILAGFFARHDRPDGHFQSIIHWMSCQLQVWSGLILGLSNIVLIGLLPVLWAPSRLSTAAALAGVAVGALDLSSKVIALLRLNHHAKVKITPRLLLKTASHIPGELAVVIEHFRLDSEAAIMTMIGSAITAATGDIKWIIAAVGFILARSLQETIPQLRSLSRKLHRKTGHEQNHDHEPSFDELIERASHGHSGHNH